MVVYASGLEKALKLFHVRSLLSLRCKMLYRLLSSPINCLVDPFYKGLYRNGPYPTPQYNEQILKMWDEYVNVIYANNRIGVSNELSFDQLKQLAFHSVVSPLCPFEIVGICDKQVNPCTYYCYGIDVASVGGHSLIGDGLFEYSKKEQLDSDLKKRIEGYHSFLNKHYLFENVEDAQSFAEMITAVNREKQSSVFEDDEWHLFHIYKIWDTSH